MVPRSSTFRRRSFGLPQLTVPSNTDCTRHGPHRAETFARRLNVSQQPSLVSACLGNAHNLAPITGYFSYWNANRNWPKNSWSLSVLRCDTDPGANPNSRKKSRSQSCLSTHLLVLWRASYSCLVISLAHGLAIPGVGPPAFARYVKCSILTFRHWPLTSTLCPAVL